MYLSKQESMETSFRKMFNHNYMVIKLIDKHHISKLIDKIKELMRREHHIFIEVPSFHPN
jgi:vacuolar-type H+-ATPase subunit F/Vma7